MKTAVYYTENAGVYFSDGNTGLLVDGIHEGETVGLSSMRREIDSLVPAGSESDGAVSAILFTHFHPDHYSAKKTAVFQKEHPDVVLWAPAHRVTDSDRKEKKAVWRRFTLGGFVVTAYDTVHSGRPFRRQPHCSMLVENRKEGEAFFVCGDAALYPELADRVRSETQEIQAAFVMIYQLLEKESLAFLTRLSPKRILLYHLPAKEEDVYAMLPMAREVLLRNPLPGKRIEVLRQHVWITERPVRR